MLDPNTVLAHLPAGLRGELVDEYQKITRNFREGRWEAAELNGGRFSEVAYTILEGYLAGGNYPAHASKPQKFEEACRHLANNPATFPKSVRILIPKVLTALYDVRNTRGVGHVGGEVDANHMDSAFVVHNAQWVMAEFVRIFHGTDLATATATVEALVERDFPMLWKVGDTTRVLVPGMKLRDSTLLLLHGSATPLRDRDLAKNLEQSSFTNYKRVLKRLHELREVEYNETTGVVTLSPLGIKYVEQDLLPKHS